jgi:transposase
MRTAYVEQHSANEPVLAVALELAKASWKVALSDARRNPRLKTVDAPQPLARLEQVVQTIAETRALWALPASARVVVVYEAGQDGFWLQRALQARALEVLVIDPASLLMARRRRLAKTDRLDALRLVEALLAWLRGEQRRFQVVCAPSVEDEDRRHWGRERQQLQRELQQHRNRIEKLLATVGCWTRLDRAGRQQLAEGTLQDWAGQALGAALQARLQRELQRWEEARTQLRRLEREHAQRFGTRQAEQVARLSQLRGIGTVGARQLVLELFWRQFRNRRQLGACVGLVPSPYDSGTLRVDQGISKQGNPRVRALLVEQAWLWLHYQPNSALSHWFAKKAGGDCRRSRRVAIVALARRLVIALWRYLERGELPAGATLKAVP